MPVAAACGFSPFLRRYGKVRRWHVAREDSIMSEKRVAMVTGGAGGIGRATSVRLAKDGWHVAVVDLDGVSAQRVAAGLGQGHRGFPCDVSDEAQVLKLFAEVESGMGPVAALVCHAGGTSHTPEHHPRIAETSLEEWTSTEALNSRSTFLCVREYFRCRARQPVEHGRIVLTSSMAAQRGGGPAGVAYSAFKAAVLGFMRTAAAEGARAGITCNAIAPGAIETPALTRTNTAEAVELMARANPLRRIGQPAEIAATVAFLVSPDASYITGVTLDVNGGSAMR